MFGRFLVSGRAVIPVPIAVSPRGGPAGGGTAFTLTGSGFTGQTSVKVGGISAPFVVVNDTTITGTTPAGMAADSFLDIQVGVTAGLGLLVNAFCTMQFTSWQSGPSVGPITVPNPWVHAASAGTSGDVQEINASFSTATGSASNGITSERYTTTLGPSHYVNTRAVHLDNSNLYTGDLITTSEYTWMGFQNLISTSPTNPGAEFQDPMSYYDGNSRFGIRETSDLGLGVFHFNGGAFEAVNAAQPFGPGKHFYCIRFGGFLGAGKIRFDVDGVNGALQNISNIVGPIVAPASAFPFTGGISSSQVGPMSFEQFDRVSLKTAVSDAIRDRYRAMILSRYGF